MSRSAKEKMSAQKFDEYVKKKVRSTIRKYCLFQKGDKICVACSGGKDSTTILYILHNLGYAVEAIHIDPQIRVYSKENTQNLVKICEKNNIPLHIITFKEEFGKSLPQMKKLLKEKGIDFSHCMICGILKRYLINKYAKKLSFDKLVTGHNLDDQAQAFLMNVFRNDIKLALRQGPVSGITRSKKFVERVKPLYEISEEEIIRYSKNKRFPIHYGMCPHSGESFRREHRRILDEFEKKHPDVKYNLIRFHEKMVGLMDKVGLKKEEVPSCSICGEPCSKDICKTCSILEKIKY